MKPIVLVLDDDQLTLELYSRQLSSEFQVITNDKVSETRQRLKDTALDALVIEPAVNDGEGWALLGEIHADPHTPPVILCSTEDERKAGLELGAHAYLVKPVLPTTLHELLRQILVRKTFHAV